MVDARLRARAYGRAARRGSAGDPRLDLARLKPRGRDPRRQRRLDEPEAPRCRGRTRRVAASTRSRGCPRESMPSRIASSTVARASGIRWSSTGRSRPDRRACPARASSQRAGTRRDRSSAVERFRMCRTLRSSIRRFIARSRTKPPCTQYRRSGVSIGAFAATDFRASRSSGAHSVFPSSWATRSNVWSSVISAADPLSPPFSRAGLWIRRWASRRSRVSR